MINFKVVPVLAFSVSGVCPAGLFESDHVTGKEAMQLLERTLALDVHCALALR